MARACQDSNQKQSTCVSHEHPRIGRKAVSLQHNYYSTSFAGCRQPPHSQKLHLTPSLPTPSHPPKPIDSPSIRAAGPGTYTWPWKGQKPTQKKHISRASGGWPTTDTNTSKTHPKHISHACRTLRRAAPDARNAEKTQKKHKKNTNKNTHKPHHKTQKKRILQCVFAHSRLGAEAAGLPRNAQEMHGKCAGNAREMRGKCAGNAREMRGKCAGNAREMRGKCAVTYTEMCCRCMGNEILARPSY